MWFSNAFSQFWHIIFEQNSLNVSKGPKTCTSRSQRVIENVYCMKEIALHTTVRLQSHTSLEPIDRKRSYLEKSLQKREDTSLGDYNDLQEKHFIEQLVQYTVKTVEIQWL